MVSEDWEIRGPTDRTIVSVERGSIECGNLEVAAHEITNYDLACQIAQYLNEQTRSNICRCCEGAGRFRGNSECPSCGGRGTTGEAVLGQSHRGDNA